MNNDNSKKARSGRNNQKELSSLLEEFQNTYKDVQIVNRKVSFGELNKKPDQFSVNAEMIFNDGSREIWIIKTSSSYRSDRSKGNEFDVEHIKKILARENKKVIAFFVVPDNQSANDLRQFNSYKSNVRNNSIVTYFDYVMTVKEFENTINERCSRYIAQGKQANILGNNAEIAISDAFNNPNNVILWNNPQDTVTKSRNIAAFSSLMRTMYPNKKLISSQAFNNNKKDTHHYLDELNMVRDSNGHGNLGKPKTDVLIKLVFDDNTKTNIKLSIKRPKANSKKVTVHEGTVESLIADLKNSIPEDSIFNDPSQFVKLQSSLINFERVGSAKNMNEELRTFLNENLSDLNGWLIDYFLFGINNHRFNQNQIANVMAIENPKNGNLIFIPCNKEKQLLLDYCQNSKLGSSSFGTPFSWTYPSKKRGAKIQVKSPLPFN